VLRLATTPLVSFIALLLRHPPTFMMVRNARPGPNPSGAAWAATKKKKYEREYHERYN
jgi:hypothetical protein